MKHLRTAEFIDALDQEGRRLAEAAAQAGPGADVPTCPDWQVRDLLAHTGRTHRWSTAYVVEGLSQYQPPADAPPGLDGTALVDWFRDGHRTLVAALRAAPDDLKSWTILPADSPLTFWARRQAHETAVHRMDAESALGTEITASEPEFAADGVDELLRGLQSMPRSRMRTDVPKTLRVRATDTGDVWTVRLSDGPPQADTTDTGVADVELSATATLLYATLWNRLPLTAVSVTGDAALARLWRETAGI